MKNASAQALPPEILIHLVTGGNQAPVFLKASQGDSNAQLE